MCRPFKLPATEVFKSNLGNYKQQFAKIDGDLSASSTTRNNEWIEPGKQTCWHSLCHVSSTKDCTGNRVSINSTLHVAAPVAGEIAIDTMLLIVSLMLSLAYLGNPLNSFYKHNEVHMKQFV